MPNPPTAAAQLLADELEKDAQGKNHSVGHWGEVAKATLHKVDEEFSTGLGEAIKLALAAVGLAAVIIEKNERGEDTAALRSLYHIVTNKADGRPSPIPVAPNIQSALANAIKEKSSQGVPVVALENLLRKLSAGDDRLSDGITRRAGGAKPLASLFARVMYCVLYSHCSNSTDKKILETDATHLTGRLGGQLKNDRINLRKMRLHDVSIDRLFNHAEREWQKQGSLSLADYISN